ncbi:MAG TPA: hypothetical protein VK034_22420 [Enhygromyxa sp.]|nr:hypothetical protein [Enhygromyxa sp.]
MPRPIFFAALLACASACGTPKPTPDDAQKSGAQESDAPQKREPEQQQPDVQPPAQPAPDGDEPPTPAWFDATKIQHSAVINQMASQGAVAGGQAWALILELEAGVSNEQCIDRAKTVIAETVPEVPEAVASDDGRLTIQGKTDDYHYTVVCGEAKGKPTMYLSYTWTR